MAGLLKYLKCTQKKDKLNTGTLPDPDGSLSRDILSSSIWDHKYRHAPSATGSIKQKEITRSIYFASTSTKVFIGKRAAENGMTAMLHYYSKAFPELALKRT